jgi:hypothetical protein
MNKANWLIVLILLHGCTTEFTSIEQARNEVNRQGYRNGRWVDYFDKNGEIVPNVSQGYVHYMLSEFKDGLFVNEARIYNSTGTLYKTCTPFPEDNIAIDKYPAEKFRFKTIVEHDSDGTIRSKLTYDINLREIERINYLKDNQNEYFESLNRKTSYYSNGLVERESNVVKIINELNVLSKSVVSVSYTEKSRISTIDFKLQEKVIAVFKDKIKEHLQIQNLLNVEGNIENVPFRIKYVALNSDTIYLDKILLDIESETKAASRSNGNTSQKGVLCNDFPFKLGCKNEIIRVIQKCFEMEPKHQTGVFCELTLNHLETKRGESIITKEVYEGIMWHCKDADVSKKSTNKNHQTSKEKADDSKNSHVCNYCQKIFYGKGYYLSYTRNGFEMNRSDNDQQELCCSSSCANKIMQ